MKVCTYTVWIHFKLLQATLNFKTENVYFILDSERSDECIDFTIMCVFFFMSVTF